MGRPATGISIAPSKKRKLKRDLQSVLRRKHYALRMKNPQARKAAQLYRKKYYAKHAAKLIEKARATYAKRKEEFKKKRQKMRAMKAKLMRKNNKLGKAANAGMKVPSNLKKAQAKAKRGSRTGSILNQAKKGKK